MGSARLRPCQPIAATPRAHGGRAEGAFAAGRCHHQTRVPRAPHTRHLSWDWPTEASPGEQTVGTDALSPTCPRNQRWVGIMGPDPQRRERDELTVQSHQHWVTSSSAQGPRDRTVTSAEPGRSWIAELRAGRAAGAPRARRQREAERNGAFVMGTRGFPRKAAQRGRAGGWEPGVK